MMSAIYAGAASVAAPCLRLMLRRRADRGKEVFARLDERRGIDATPRPPGTLMWLHAASVGETVSILGVLDALVPLAAVLVTTGTTTSAALLASQRPGVLHRFVPLDVPAWAARFLDHWRPDVACFVESELWPNLLSACRERGIPAMLLNARMSARSFDGWRRAPEFARAVLGTFAAVRAQSETDAARLRALGARAVTTPGNLKFAAGPLVCDPAAFAALQARIGARPVWLAASTHPGEDEIVLAADRALRPSHPDLLTMIAPRHPDRGAAIAALAAGATRRSAGQPPEGPVWVADTLGELGLLYRLAPIVFVGCSLIAPGGGHNVLEPARLGCALATGPFTGNFADAAEVLETAAGLVRVRDAATMAAFVAAMLADPAARGAMAGAARAAADRSAGLPEQTAEALLALARAR